MFVLYDGRAKVPGQEDAAMPMDLAATEAEARAQGEAWANHDAVWFEYDEKGDELVNGRPRWDIPPSKQLTDEELEIVRRVFAPNANRGRGQRGPQRRRR